jgi:regulatory protein
MRVLARRELSREELKRKLAAHAAQDENLDAVLDELAAKGWLSDARYAEQAIRSKARRYGPVKLAHVLRAKGLDDEAIAAAFRAAGHEGETNLEAVWKSRFRAAPADERDRARQVRFLQGRGFRLDDILRYLKTLEAST